ncbi:sodium:proton antiporter [Pseudogracilibacillus sp. SE30717A]|uniref:cation:proton antiporter n=1 Tax=Pseudogracilibacillus sp. SE30717A TaxID=3098293 RepID=UPI00300E3610
MDNIELIFIVTILGLGIFSQWFAWRIQWPSIVIMSIVGLLIGPVIGFIDPKTALGDLYSPLISLAVAIILFEGSSSLDLREIKDVSKSVFRIITGGAFIAWILGSLSAHYIAGLSLEVSFIIGGLFVVTGPTVIIPLLRNAKLQPRTAAVLKWEGIIVDPAGPLLALFAYEIIKVLKHAQLGPNYLLFFLGSALLAAILGFIIGTFISIMANKGMFPEYLKSPILLAFVLICFTIAEMIMHETGMLAVTVMGLTVGRARKHVSSIGNIHHFIEGISVLLTSTVFILLTASLDRETISQIFTWPIIAFVLVMLFIVRPISIWLPTIGTELTNKEKTLIGWIAPRGIVALTVAGYFATILEEDGYRDAATLTALTFALVFITVCVHGFTLGPLAKKLGLSNQDSQGVVIVGASSFSIVLAKKLKEMQVEVLIVDSSRGRLRPAKYHDIPTYEGEILSEHAQFEADLTPYNTILAMTIDASYNMLVTQSFAPEFGYQNTFSLPASADSSLSQDSSSAVKAHLLFDEDAIFTELNRKINTNYSLDTITITEEKNITKETLPTRTTPLFVRKTNNDIVFINHRTKLEFEEGDQLVVLKPLEE